MNTNTRASIPRPVTRVMLVDDDQFMLVVVGDILKEIGIANVVTATNGAAALQAFDVAALKPDVVLCDLSMPGSDGFELMEQLAAKHFTGGIIIFSGLDDRALKSAALMVQFHRLQFLDTLKKPVEKQALKAALAKLH